MGVPYHGMAVPFYDNHSIDGSVVAIYPAYTEGKSVVTVKTAGRMGSRSFFRSEVFRSAEPENDRSRRSYYWYP